MLTNSIWTVNTYVGLNTFIKFSEIPKQIMSEKKEYIFTHYLKKFQSNFRKYSVTFLVQLLSAAKFILIDTLKL